MEEVATRPVQATYGRKKGYTSKDVDAAASSSSPSHVFVSSPTRSLEGVLKDEDPSCNTTISSDNGEEEDEDVIVARKRPILFLTDDEDNDDEGELKEAEGGSEGEDDAAYLKRFREARRSKLDVPIQREVSSSLSDPPTLSNSSRAPGSGSPGRRLLPSQMSPLSPEPESHISAPFDTSSQSQVSISNSPYITEAQKQQQEHLRKTSRENKVKELAKKRAKGKQDFASVEGAFGEEADDEVESITSDVPEEVDDHEDLPTPREAIKEASRKRRLADDRKRAMEEASKASRKTKGSTKAGVLQMRVEDDSDSDLEFERSRNVPEKGPKEQPMKPLSKKEIEEMHKTQARIERELKASNAKAANVRSERPVFGLNDLLSNFEQQEGANKTRSTTTVRRDDDANNSDPIESASEGEDGMGPSLPPINLSRRPARFTPALKELSPDLPEDRKLREESEELPTESELLRSVINEQARKTKLEALKERKAQALLRQVASQQKLEGEEEDDDVLFIDTKAQAGQKMPVMIKPLANKGQNGNRITRSGSPGGLTDGDSGDDLVTDGQIFRAGKALGPPKEEKKSIAKVKGQKAHQEEKLTVEQLNEKMLKHARLQNIDNRRKREAAYGMKKESEKKTEPENSGEDVGDMLRRMREQNEQAGEGKDESEDSEADGSEYNPDGSIQEDEIVDLGSADEDDQDEGSVEHDSVSEAGSNDSEKENSAPASQEDLEQVRMPRRPRIVIDDDEDEDEAGDKTITLSQGRSPLQPIEIVAEENNDAESHHSTSPAPGRLSHESSDAGFSQFFQDTQVPAVRVQANAQTLSPPPRNISSTLGKFFEDTQPDQPLRGESFPVLRDESGKSALPGFTQLFGEGTQLPLEHNSRLMPPPITSAKGLSLVGGTDQDAFAALRKAQASEAQELDFDADDLPSLEQVGGMDEDHLAALEMEALQAEIEERQSKEKKMRDEANVTYINKDGFFTQTKPEFERYSLSQSQSQSQNQSLRARWEDHGSSMDSGVEPEIPIKTKKRFRRAVSIEAARDDDNSSQIDAAPAVDEGSQKGADAEPRANEDYNAASRNAFEVLKGAMNRRQESASPSPVKGRKNRFVQGEAEESDDDEEDGPVNKKHKKGGLDGVFSDDEGGSDEEEEDEEDGADLEELIDEEQDEKEAEKDILARERYLKDVEADDQAALALHEKATRGGLRNKKRAPGTDGLLDGFLDEDYEEEWAERTVKNPYGHVPKKRRFEGKDGLDLLEANEETQAFVRKYRDADEEIDLDKYDFLLPAEGDDEEEEAKRGRQDDSDDDEEIDEPQILTRRQLQDEIKERRRKRQAVGESDDEDDNEAKAEEEAAAEKLEEEKRMMEKIQREIYAHSSDDEDADLTSGQAVVRDRLRERLRPAKPALNLEDDDIETAYSDLSRIAKSRPLTEREQQRLSQLQSEYANEPEWGNQDGPRKANNSSGNGTGSSVTSFGSRRAMIKNSSSKSDLNDPVHRLLRPRSKLTDVMSRKSQFSESQDD